MSADTVVVVFTNSVSWFLGATTVLAYAGCFAIGAMLHRMYRK